MYFKCNTFNISRIRFHSITPIELSVKRIQGEKHKTMGSAVPLRHKVKTINQIPGQNLKSASNPSGFSMGRLKGLPLFGDFSFTWRAAMQNNHRQEYVNSITLHVSIKEHEKESVRQDARRFQEHVRNSRIRLGLEASHEAL